MHDLGHYLRNPAVHIALFRALVPISGVITPTEEKDAIDKHREDNPIAKAKKWIGQLKDFRLSDEEGDWTKILPMIHKFFQ